MFLRPSPQALKLYSDPTQDIPILNTIPKLNLTAVCTKAKQTNSELSTLRACIPFLPIFCHFKENLISPLLKNFDTIFGVRKEPDFAKNLPNVGPKNSKGKALLLQFSPKNILELGSSNIHCSHSKEYLQQWYL